MFHFCISTANFFRDPNLLLTLDGRLSLILFYYNFPILVSLQFLVYYSLHRKIPFHFPVNFPNFSLQKQLIDKIKYRQQLSMFQKPEQSVTLHVTRVLYKIISGTTSIFLCEKNIKLFNRSHYFCNNRTHNNQLSDQITKTKTKSPQ